MELSEVRQTSWTLEEEELLAYRFEAGRTLEELSQLHGRTPAAIVTRLARMRRVINVGGQVYKLDLWADTRREK